MPSELIQRDPCVKRPPLSHTPKLINIYHPGYENNDAPLLVFPGYDSSQGDLWHDLAHTACAIISNNQFDGYISRSKDPESTRVLEELLAPGNYWWHVPRDLVQPYAIVADFRSWQFPTIVPENWRSEIIMEQAKATTCQVSQEEHALHTAYIVPKSETEWFNKSGIGFLYCSNFWQMAGTPFDGSIDNSDNLLTLRSDLHNAWDQKFYTFVPKKTRDGLGMVLHCWNQEMVGGYHNLPLQGLVRREALLARLAWTLLPRAVTQFLINAKEPRMLWIRDDHGKLIPQKTSAEECTAMVYAPPTRSSSPKKRKQNDGEQQPMDSCKKQPRTSYGSLESELGTREEGNSREEDEDGNLKGQDDDSGSQSIVNLEEYTRGRKRVRTADGWYLKPES